MIIPVALICDKIGVPEKIRFFRFTFNGEDPSTTFVNPYMLAFHQLYDFLMYLDGTGQIASKTAVHRRWNGNGFDVTPDYDRDGGWAYDNLGCLMLSDTRRPDFEAHKARAMRTIIPECVEIVPQGVFELTFGEMEQKLPNSGIVRKPYPGGRMGYRITYYYTRPAVINVAGEVVEPFTQIITPLIPRGTILNNILYTSLVKWGDNQPFWIVDHEGTCKMFRKSVLADLMYNRRLIVGTQFPKIKNHFELRKYWTRNGKSNMSFSVTHTAKDLAKGLETFMIIPSKVKNLDAVKPISYYIDCVAGEDYAYVSSEDAALEELSGLTRTGGINKDIAILTLPAHWVSFSNGSSNSDSEYPNLNVVTTEAQMMSYLGLVGAFPNLGTIKSPHRMQSLFLENNTQPCTQTYIYPPNELGDTVYSDPGRWLSYPKTYINNEETELEFEALAERYKNGGYVSFEMDSVSRSHLYPDSIVGLYIANWVLQNQEFNIPVSANINEVLLNASAPNLEKLRLPYGTLRPAYMPNDMKYKEIFTTQVYLDNAAKLKYVEFYQPPRSVAFAASNRNFVVLQLNDIANDMIIKTPGKLGTLLLRFSNDVPITVHLGIEQAQRLYIAGDPNVPITIVIHGRKPRNCVTLGNVIIKGAK